MKITIFSFIMAIIWSTCVTLILILFIKKRSFVIRFSIPEILILFLLPAVRMLIPVEFTFTKEVTSIKMVNNIYQLLCLEVIEPGKFKISVSSLLLFIWIVGSLILTLRFFINYIQVIKVLYSYTENNNEQIQRIAHNVSFGIRYHRNIKIIISNNIDIPMGIGIFKKMILLPDQVYSDDDLKYIILHEYTHFKNKDLELKMLTQLYCFIFWWNPAVYLFRKELQQLLEIKCDLTVIKDFDNRQKVNYLSAILRMIKKSNNKRMIYGNKAVSLFGNNQESSIAERFSIISSGETTSRNKVMVFLFYVCFLIVYLLSYYFVLQSKFSVPENEIYTESDVFESIYISQRCEVASSAGVKLYSDSTIYKYRVINGRTQYRGWNETKNCWVDSNWIYL